MSCGKSTAALKINGEMNHGHKKAKENREEFFIPYQEKFRKIECKKERSKIISKLIAIEPSHLGENQASKGNKKIFPCEAFLRSAKGGEK